MTPFALVLPFFANASATPGQPGTLDETFGVGGISSFLIDPYEQIVSGAGSEIALQSDGKLIHAGYCYSTPTVPGGLGPKVACVLRYLSNGTLDPSFGVGGIARADAQGLPPIDLAAGVVIQPDGKIVVAAACGGYIASDFCVLRFLANGQLDSSFGTQGATRAFKRFYDSPGAMALQADGKLVVAGGCSLTSDFGDAPRFCAVRFSQSGALDTNFGNAGWVTTAIVGNRDQALALVVQPDNKLVLHGRCLSNALNPNGNEVYDFCAARYLPDGSLDAGFGSGGKVINPFPANFDATPQNLALFPDGTLIASGECDGPSVIAICITRYLPNGALDLRFGVGGRLIYDEDNEPNRFGFIRQIGLAIEPDGGVVLAAECYNDFKVKLCARRFRYDGTHDKSFGTLGQAVTEADIASRTLLLQPDGKIVVGGYCTNSSTLYRFCVARFEGGPFGYRHCTLDIDGDNRVTPAVDGVIATRVMLGFVGDAVMQNVSFASHATRTSWPAIREHLIAQCGLSIR